MGRGRAVSIDKAIEAYLREALKEFEKEESKHYIPANVRRVVGHGRRPQASENERARIEWANECSRRSHGGYAKGP